MHSTCYARRKFVKLEEGDIMKFVEVTVFSKRRGGGNPCLIIDDIQDLSEEKMQQLATKKNFPESVFILRDKQTSKITLRFFTPKSELPLCCHGALGAAYYLLHNGATSPLTLFSFQEDKKLNLFIENDMVSMQVSTGKQLPIGIDPKTAVNLLNLDSDQQLSSKLPFCVASIGSPKLLIPLHNEKTLLELEPNNFLIKEWSKQNHVNGVYAYAKDEKIPNCFMARNFNPRFSDNEDVATGVAAPALASIIHNASGKKKIEIYTINQGENLGKPSQLFVTVSQKDIKLTGNVRLLHEETETLIQDEISPASLEQRLTQGDNTAH